MQSGYQVDPDFAKHTTFLYKPAYALGSPGWDIADRLAKLLYKYA